MWSCSLSPLGDRALIVDLPGTAGVPPRLLVRALADRLAADALPGVTALLPAIHSVAVHYDPRRTSFAALQAHMTQVLATLEPSREPESEPIVIPVCYGGEFGPDLEELATTHGTTPDAIIAQHTEAVYNVAMIGFLPGFPYLEGLAPTLHTPRRATPRTAVPAGSIGIGGSSTGIYPFTSPGGWNIIGRTPRVLFSPRREQPSLLHAGDRVRFSAISAAALRTMAEQP